MEKNLRARAKAGQISYGLMLSMSDPAVVEMAALAGYDYVRLDCEHTLFDYSTMVDMIRTANLLNLPIMVRISSQDDVTRLLDAGISGIMMPGVNNKAEAINAVNLVKYAPLGARGMFKGSRAYKYGDVDLTAAVSEEVNKQISLIIQIESKEGLDNIDEILSVDGIDFVATGRNDLSQSLGLIGQATHPKVMAAEELVIKKCVQYGKFPNLLASSPARVAELKKMGVVTFTVHRDTNMLYESMKKNIASFK